MCPTLNGTREPPSGCTNDTTTTLTNRHLRSDRRHLIGRSSLPGLKGVCPGCATAPRPPDAPTRLDLRRPRPHACRLPQPLSATIDRRRSREWDCETFGRYPWSARRTPQSPPAPEANTRRARIRRPPRSTAPAGRNRASRHPTDPLLRRADQLRPEWDKRAASMATVESARRLSHAAYHCPPSRASTTVSTHLAVSAGCDIGAPGDQSEGRHARRTRAPRVSRGRNRVLPPHGGGFTCRRGRQNDADDHLLSAHPVSLVTKRRLVKRDVDRPAG